MQCNPENSFYTEKFSENWGSDLDKNVRFDKNGENSRFLKMADFEMTEFENG